MQTIFRQCIGIDIAKSTFTACICQQFNTGQTTCSPVSEFEHSRHGFNQLLKWVRKHAVVAPQAVFVMEATGIYYEPLAYHLHELGQPVCVVLPNKVKHYAKSLNIKSKTDIIDARLIAQMGAERALEEWTPPAEVFRNLRALTRLYTDIKSQKTAFVNRLHSMEAGHEPLPFIVRSTKEMIRKLDREIDKTKAEITTLIASDQGLQQKVDKLLTIKGVGLMTIAIVVAETQGFKLITNVKQLASYAGYDVVQRESGSSTKGKTRISKKGNSRIRAALYFPALVAARHNKNFQGMYQRINQSKASKMVGVTAVQRKLLILLYTLWREDTVYDENKANKTSGNQETKFLLRLNDAVVEKQQADPKSLPAQDELPLNLSTEALLRL
ncbi:IS110 family transposase [Chitinophagaceae bacterium LB-8]|uniref:IS110 family transposase n=1 Tax=Paraflavisolibacter caeni TaxID=2982496 RepID=A0A9X3B8B1_9BACT|nr:IS110 family transposase [Paraflavisolibacter caeni]MCU7550445.1 IS110 family transposase [Paraflavisolibacter caeni]